MVYLVFWSSFEEISIEMEDNTVGAILWDRSERSFAREHLILISSRTVAKAQGKQCRLRKKRLEIIQYTFPVIDCAIVASTWCWG